MASLTEQMQKRSQEAFALMQRGDAPSIPYDVLLSVFGADSLQLCRSVNLVEGALAIDADSWNEFINRFQQCNGDSSLTALFDQVSRASSGSQTGCRGVLPFEWPRIPTQLPSQTTLNVLGAVARKLAGLQTVASWDGTRQSLDTIVSRLALGDRLLLNLEETDESLEAVAASLVDSGVEAAFLIRDMAEWIAELNSKASIPVPCACCETLAGCRWRDMKSNWT